MVKSMTGYGRSQVAASGYDVTVEIKSVNHRYFEFSSRVPRVYGYLDDMLKNYIHQQVTRGKIDVFVGLIPIDKADTAVHINHALAGSYLEELRLLGTSLGLEDNITLCDISNFSDIYTLQKQPEDEGIIWELVRSVTDGALKQFVEMRSAEGGRLKEDILDRLTLLEGYISEIEKNSPIITEKWRERLYNKVSTVLEDRQVDEGRLLTEVAIFAEKIAVDEETVRLRSHINQFREILGEQDAVGRKLDFLVQETNREINTIGSKSQDVEAARIVVEMKSETEKIREQIQNIE